MKKVESLNALTIEQAETIKKIVKNYNDGIISADEFFTVCASYRKIYDEEKRLINDGKMFYIKD